MCTRGEIYDLFFNTPVRDQMELIRITEFVHIWLQFAPLIEMQVSFVAYVRARDQAHFSLANLGIARERNHNRLDSMCSAQIPGQSRGARGCPVISNTESSPPQASACCTRAGYGARLTSQAVAAQEVGACAAFGLGLHQVWAARRLCLLGVTVCVTVCYCRPHAGQSSVRREAPRK